VRRHDDPLTVLPFHRLYRPEPGQHAARPDDELAAIAAFDQGATAAHVRHDPILQDPVRQLGLAWRRRAGCDRSRRFRSSGTAFVQPIDGIGDMGKLRRRISRRRLDAVEAVCDLGEFDVGAVVCAVETGLYGGKLRGLRAQPLQNIGWFSRLRVGDAGTTDPARPRCA